MVSKEKSKGSKDTKQQNIKESWRKKTACSQCLAEQKINVTSLMVKDQTQRSIGKDQCSKTDTLCLQIHGFVSLA